MGFLSNLVPFLLSSQTLFTHSVTAFPASLSARGSNDPGIGVGLEWRGGVITNPDKRAIEGDALAKAAGAKVIVKGKKTFTNEWKLSAKHAADIENNELKKMVYEWIVLGDVVKLEKGRNKLPSIVEDIRSSLADWNPKAGDKVAIDGLDEAKSGTWSVAQPKDFVADTVSLGIQVTAPLPLDALYDLLKMVQNNDQNNPFSPVGRPVSVIEKSDLAGLDVMDEEDIDDNVLGFFSLIMSYAKAAKSVGIQMKTNGPKQLINFMPRTDFATMFNIYIKDKLENGRKCRDKKKADINVFTIARDLGKKSDINLGDLKFYWQLAKPSGSEGPPATGAPAPPPASSKRALDTTATWTTKQRDKDSGTLELKTWLLELDEGKDALSIMDDLVFDKQIGNLGSMTESNLYDANQNLPIFQMRDISGVALKDVAGKMQQLEEKVKAYHEKATKSGAKKRRQSAPSKSCKRRKTESKDPKKTGNPEKIQGKCPEGQVLDPVQGGQDKDTDKPVCIADDDKKCPTGQIAETRRKGYKVPDETTYDPKCSKPEPRDENFKCAKANTYHHIETPIGEDKQRHSCRSTRKAEEEKINKYKQVSKSTSEGKSKMDKDKNEKKRAEKRRARAGSCWVLVAEAGAFAVEELQNMSQDELDGMMDTWPDESIADPIDMGTIPDHVVKVTRRILATADTQTAGFPNIFRVFSAGAKAGNAANKPSAAIAKQYKTGSKGQASAKAVQAAKVSKMVEKILKDKRFLDCLSTTAESIGGNIANVGSTGENRDLKNIKIEGDSIVDIDWSRKPSLKDQPEDKGDKRISMHIGTGEDWDTYADQAAWLYSFPDGYIRHDRLLYETCQPASDAGTAYKNSIKAAEVQGGCCNFYSSDNCAPKTNLFSMENRQHGDLQGKHRKAINSWWCTFEPGCKGAP